MVAGITLVLKRGRLPGPSRQHGQRRLARGGVPPPLCREEPGGRRHPHRHRHHPRAPRGDLCPARPHRGARPGRRPLLLRLPERLRGHARSECARAARRAPPPPTSASSRRTSPWARCAARGFSPRAPRPGSRSPSALCASRTSPWTPATSRPRRCSRTIPSLTPSSAPPTRLPTAPVTCLREYGRAVPEEVEVTGMDDSEISQIVHPHAHHRPPSLQDLRHGDGADARGAS